MLAPTPTPNVPVPTSPAVDVSPTVPPTLWPVDVTDWPAPDPWAARSFWASVFFGIVSVAVGAAAVYLARQANKAAVKAAHEAERANVEASRARAAVAAERRRTFQLEILRDLLEEVDDGARGLPPNRIRFQGEEVLVIYSRPSEVMQRYVGRLELLEHDDLPFWRRMLVMRKGDLHQEIDDEDMYDLGDLLRDRLRADVVAAIRRRMDDRDA